jgi:hypothetical protein
MVVIKGRTIPFIKKIESKASPGPSLLIFLKTSVKLPGKMFVIDGRLIAHLPTPNGWRSPELF